MNITRFDGEYEFLSNFYPCEVMLDGVKYPSTENAYQAAKTTPENRSGFVNCTAADSKTLGRKCKMRSDWDEVKISVMRDLLVQKFAPGTELAEKLIKTQGSELVEGNHWGDVFWGVCKGVGQNHLGKLLMEIREKLIQETVDEDVKNWIKLSEAAGAKRLDF
jgi:ribA/ribD-fused uncharacterized protein